VEASERYRRADHPLDPFHAIEHHEGPQDDTVTLVNAGMVRMLADRLLGDVCSFNADRVIAVAAWAGNDDAAKKDSAISAHLTRSVTRNFIGKSSAVEQSTLRGGS